MRTDRRWDGEIVALAVPAAATLAAEPAYLLTDTALVGTLGTEALAGLAVANTIILAAYTVFIFLTFATTAAVARLLGAERHRDAAEEGVTATWLGAMLGVMVAAVVLPLAPTLARLFGAEAAVVADAVTYLRISTAGFPRVVDRDGRRRLSSRAPRHPDAVVRRLRHGADQPGDRGGAPDRVGLRHRRLGPLDGDRPVGRRTGVRRAGGRRGTSPPGGPGARTWGESEPSFASAPP
jgi:hypothetical protein